MWMPEEKSVSSNSLDVLNSPENQERIAKFKAMDAADDDRRKAAAKTFDVKAFALQTSKIYEKEHPRLGVIRYGILTSAEAEPLHFEQYVALLAPLQRQVEAEQAVYDKVSGKFGVDSVQAKGSLGVLEDLKVKLAKARFESDKQIMLQAAYGMLHKADPSITPEDWANLPFDVKNLVAEALAVEMPSFLRALQLSGLTPAPRLSKPC
jgi:hypothetical protein